MNDDGRTVAAMDLLAPGIGELVGGSQREERLDYLEKRMDEMVLNKEDYWWYLDIRKYGGVRHAGFGLGFERLLMYLTGMTNIRDVFPSATLKMLSSDTMVRQGETKGPRQRDVLFVSLKVRLNRPQVCRQNAVRRG